MSYFKTYANSFQAKSILGLEAISMLLEKLGNPQKDLKIVHVAGTNGKGSVCAFLQNILTQSGRKTGKFISPNMIDVYERISIDGKDILPEEMDKLLKRAEIASGEIKAEKGDMPTQFEIWTAVALLYFKEHCCDNVVLETGLGGRLDATNIIKAPLCSVITRIGIDHTEYLGDTIEKIAFEKAGIIKKNCPVVTLCDQRGLSVIEKKAAEQGCRVILTGTAKNIRYDDSGSVFDYDEYKNLKINMGGDFQTENAALATEAAKLLNIDEKYIRLGLEKAVNMGRFEKIYDNPTVIFDGAHNENGIKAFVKAVKSRFNTDNAAVVYGAMADKDIAANVKILSDNGFLKCKIFTVTVKCNPRAETAENLAHIFTEHGFNAVPCEDAKEAIKKAKKCADVVFVFGSLYLYKDINKSVI